MQARFAFLGSAIAIISVAGFLSTAEAAGGPAATCSEQWAKMKVDGTVEADLTWPKFLARCSAETAAVQGDAAAKVTKVAAIGAFAASNGEKKACDAKWGAYKTENKVHGWKAYFTFMAGCM